METTLPPIVIAQLYGSSFIIPETETAVKNLQPVDVEPKDVDEDNETVTEINALQTQTPTRWFLGNNEKHIAIIVNNKEHAFVAEAQLQFLTNILTACHLNMDDVALVNMHTQQQTVAEVKQLLQSRYMILFGIAADTIGLPFTIPQYQIQNYNQCAYLFAPELKILHGNTAVAKEQKTKLWVSLKKMFDI